MWDSSPSLKEAKGPHEVVAGTAGGREPQPRKTAPQFFSAFVGSLERLVVDSQELVYPRLYAWWKLTKLHGSLRFDDHRGLLPERLVWSSQGLSGTLVRTKTSGSGKARETLPLWVSSRAWVAEREWLATGYKLWIEHGTARDYFLMLPTPDLNGVVPAEARYADAVAMSRAVLTKLRRPDGGPLLVDDRLASFWTEHSERATLPSWCGTLAKFPEDWIAVLGRWGSSTGSGHVRTHRKRVSEMQVTVVEIIREGRAWKQFAEEDLLQGLLEYMSSLGMEPEKIAEQKKALLVSTLPEVLEAAVISPTEEVADEESADEEGARGDLAPSADGTSEDRAEESSAEAEGPEDEQEGAAEELAVQLGHYVVSLRRGSKVRTLRLKGSCHRVPGVDYADWRNYGEARPPASEYTWVCRQCWPQGLMPEGGSEDVDSDSSSSDGRE